MYAALFLLLTIVSRNCLAGNSTGGVFAAQKRLVVTDQAMGARCAVAADFDGDGLMDLVSASSNDNAVSWFRNQGVNPSTGQLSFSIKQQITWSSLGSRIVTTGDVDADGDMDVIGASYYDSTVRWFENDGKGNFSPHIISRAVSEGQGVTVADLDNDGDLDIVTASSGDNTVAVFKNLDRGVFCEIKEVVDGDAIGVRTVVASDLDGDGWLDLASASKDDHSVSWYPNDGAGSFPTKILISAGSESEGAYSLVAIDIDGDNDNDLIVASNGNDHVSLWRNNGKGNFTKTLIYDNADFVLSVTAVDFDRDGDLDVASASFFDGYIRWYENMDGVGSQWKNHTLYVGIQGHYVSHADLDGDGDDDLIAVTHAENTVAIFLAKTNCDFGSTQECCAVGKTWNGSACVLCSRGTYGVGSGIEANCKPCPTETCTITGSNFLPATCSGITDCANPDLSIAACACLADFVKHSLTDTCIPCPQGQRRPSKMERSADTLGNYTAWEQQQGVCTLDRKYDWRPVIYCIAVFVMLLIIGLVLYCRKLSALAKADAVWIIPGAEITYDQPTTVLGQGSFGVVSKGYYRGTPVAVKKAMPKERPASKTGSGKMSPSSGSGGFAFSDSLGQKGFAQSVSFGRNGFAQSGSFGRNGGTSQFASLTGTIMKNGLKNNLISEFAKEMRIVAKLRHPCITTVMGAVLSDEPLLVMEYMGNGSMRELLSNETFPFDPELSLPLIRDILEGMRFLHAAASPIIHGDLKTANVLVDENFRAKIADFGLSSKRKVRFVGTPFWMAPELLQGANISRESDVYAFGVTLWEVMTRKVPYADSFMSSDEILEKVKMGEMRPNCDSGLETELVQCMQDCWAQQPEKRSTLNELALKLIPLCGQNFHTVMQTRHNAARKQRCLLEDVFPEHIAKALLAGRKVEPEHHDCVTVYFCDIVGFTTLSSTLSPQQVSEMLDRLYTAFDSLADNHKVYKLETIGDSWVGVCNLTQEQPDHAARIARFSIDAIEVAQATIIQPDQPEMGTVKIRVGFHSGPVVSNVVGKRNPRYCLFGDTINTASRMESNSEELRIHCSATAARLAQRHDASLKFVTRGRIPIKGKSLMETFWLEADAKQPTGHAEQSCPLTRAILPIPSVSPDDNGSVSDVELSISVHA